MVHVCFPLFGIVTYVVFPRSWLYSHGYPELQILYYFTGALVSLLSSSVRSSVLVLMLSIPLYLVVLLFAWIVLSGPPANISMLCSDIVSHNSCLQISVPLLSLIWVSLCVVSVTYVFF